MNLDFTDYNIYVTGLKFILLALSLITFIIGLGSYWRTKHRLKTALGLLQIGLGIIILRISSAMLGADQLSYWNNLILFFDLAAAIFLLAGFAHIYKIIKILDKEET